MIGLVDYGLGNLEAFANIYRRAGIEARRLSRPEDIATAGRLILPGVGAFDWAMDRLNGSGLRDALDEAVLVRRIPVLGICVGMQMMMERSEEGSTPGLGWIKGDVIRLPARGAEFPLPHMGWNDVIPRGDGPLFDNIDAPRFYFLHSYHVTTQTTDAILAEADYGMTLTCAVQQDHIRGVQFHPEKSHGCGIRLLENFAAMPLDRC
jgi:glutamine amidotransferase